MVGLCKKCSHIFTIENFILFFSFFSLQHSPRHHQLGHEVKIGEKHEKSRSQFEDLSKDLPENLRRYSFSLNSRDEVQNLSSATSLDPSKLSEKSGNANDLLISK